MTLLCIPLSDVAHSCRCHLHKYTSHGSSAISNFTNNNIFSLFQLLIAAIVAVAAADRPAPRAYSAPAPPSYSAPAPQQYGQKVPQILSQEFDLRDDQSYDSRLVGV